MKKLLCIGFLALFLMGCSATAPTVDTENVSSDIVVTGQRILAQVDAISDNPPMTYQWSASGGTLEGADEPTYAVLWIAPDEPGRYTITCIISDQSDKRTTRTFSVLVNPRALETLVGPDKVALAIAKQMDSRLGGVWTSIRDNYIRFFSSRSDADTTWKKNFTTMIARMSADGTEYVFWGVDESDTRSIVALSSSAESTLECLTCTEPDVINSLAIDVIDTNILWVGADSGLHYYNATITDAPWGTYLNGVSPFYDLFEGPDFVYAASDAGVYQLSNTTTPLYDGDTRAVYALDNGDTTVTVWAVVAGAVEKDGVPLGVQPAEVANSIDVDPSGNIWCGKYWLNPTGTAWQQVPGIEAVTIVRSVASNEGLIYLLSDSGSLYRW